MRFVDEFRDRKLAQSLSRKIRQAMDGRAPLSLMEVCGTHTMAIFRFGLKDLLPDNLRLISGPGCPVCVTPTAFIDKAIALARMDTVTIATFGDMMRVPGSESSLEKEKMNGRSIRAVYSTMDALDIARRDTQREVVFLGVGFETTVPTVAVALMDAKKRKIPNFSVLCGHKTMPEVLAVLAKDKDTRVDGFILPAHVSAIIGSRPYESLARRFGKHCIIAGFEPIDILQGILILLDQSRPAIDVQYERVVRRLGNRSAQKVIRHVFKKADSSWRGIGVIPGSGLAIRDRYAGFDAEERFPITIRDVKEKKGCICGDVLKGKKTPLDCRLFRKACKPEHPVGPCMVSSEGACSAYYKYGNSV